MFGVASLGELADHSASSLLVDPDVRAAEIALLDAEGAVREFELEIRRPDGHTRTVLDTAHKVLDADTGETLYHGILVDITDRKELEQQLRDLAIRDPLTGCFNRRHMQSVIADLDAADQSVGVVVADIDHFKTYNDTYGHDMGDRLLVKIGRFLLSKVRDADPVIRTGGDEFAILLPGANATSTQRVVDRLMTAGRDASPVSFTLGWAVREPGEDVEETCRRADQHLIRVRVETRAPQPRT